MTGAGAVRVRARPGTIDDIGPIVALANAARASLTDVRGGPILLATDRRIGADPANLESAVADDTANVIVGTLDDVVVGYLLAALVPTPSGQLLAKIEELYVEPEARQVGVAAAMISPALSWATKHGCDGIDAFALPGDRATKNFFESNGLVARAIIAHRSLPADPEPPP